MLNGTITQYEFWRRLNSPPPNRIHSIFFCDFQSNQNNNNNWNVSRRHEIHHFLIIKYMLYVFNACKIKWKKKFYQFQLWMYHLGHVRPFCKSFQYSNRVDLRACPYQITVCYPLLRIFLIHWVSKMKFCFIFVFNFCERAKMYLMENHTASIHFHTYNNLLFAQHIFRAGKFFSFTFGNN